MDDEMSAYIICHYDVTDSDRIDQLGPISIGIIEKYGGKIAVASSVENLEDSPYSRLVMYEFPDTASAKAYYESSENQEFVKLRREMTEGFVVFAPGYKG